MIVQFELVGIDRGTEDLALLLGLVPANIVCLLVVGPCEKPVRQGFRAHALEQGCGLVIDVGVPALSRIEREFFALLVANVISLRSVTHCTFDEYYLQDGAVEDVLIPDDPPSTLFGELQAAATRGAQLGSYSGFLELRFSAHVRNISLFGRLAKECVTLLCEGPFGDGSQARSSLRDDLFGSEVPAKVLRYSEGFSSFGAPCSRLARQFRDLGNLGQQAQRALPAELGAGQFCGFLFWLAHYFESVAFELAGQSRFSLASHFGFRSLECISIYWLLGKNSASVNDRGRLLVHGREAPGAFASVSEAAGLLGIGEHKKLVSEIVRRRNSSVFGHGFSHTGKEYFNHLAAFLASVFDGIDKRDAWSQQRRKDLSRRYGAISGAFSNHSEAALLAVSDDVAWGEMKP